MNPSFDIWSIIFLVAGAQGLFLSTVIFSKKSRLNSLLASLILLFTLCLFYYVSYWTEISKELPYIFSITLGFTYLIGPLLYFYIRSDSQQLYFRTIHFLPFAGFLIYYFSYPYITTNYRPISNTVQVIIQNTHLIAYTVYVYKWIGGQKSQQNGALKLYNWRKQIFIAFCGYTASFLLYYVLVWTSLLRVEYDYMISIASSFFIYFVGYKGFVNPQLIEQHTKPKYENSLLSSSASQSVLKKIKELLEAERLYLNSDLKMIDIANQLSLSTHHISQVINSQEGKSFSEFINQYRLRDAKLILSDPLNRQAKLIDVAYDTGFNNKTSFNNAFKKHVGMSPSQYRTNQKVKVSY